MATTRPMTGQILIFPTSLTRPIFRPRTDMGRPKGSKDTLSRSKRVRQQAPAFVMTERDRAMLAAVAIYRRLNTAQLTRLFFTPGTASRCRQRLAVLHHHGYLHRIGGRLAPYVFFLDREGVKLLVDDPSIPRELVRVFPKDKAVYPAHEVKSNDIRIELTLACAHAGVELSEWWEEPELAQLHTANPVTVMLSDGTIETAALIPDDYFVIETGERPFSCFVEIDMHTETGRAISQAKLKKDWAWKIQRYQEFFRKPGRDVPSLYERLYNTGNKGRMLTITTTEGRLKTLQHITEEEGGRERYWFTTFERIESGNILSDYLWNIASRGDTREQLVRLSVAQPAQNVNAGS
jgi:hypothetical protein